ncbi:hypothetical protein, partial [Salmonella sp. NW973]|uniref:hypothetical protein n=1 Tax=Salmonella sp. NW973 TaxID=2948459 RepID=UPI003F688C14
FNTSFSFVDFVLFQFNSTGFFRAMTNGTKGSMSTNIGSWSPETISSYFASGSSYYDWSGWWSLSY